MRIIKISFLYLLLVFSMFHTTISLSMMRPPQVFPAQAPAAPEPADNAEPETSWLGKALYFVGPIIAHLILKEVLTFVVKKYYGNELYERAKIKSLIKINQVLKKQLDYIKYNCRDKKLIKSMEEKYLHSCIKLLELQKQYLDTYEKNKAK